MIIQILSDLHREFYRQRRERAELPWRPSEKADVIALAGDIDYGLDAIEWLIGESEQLCKPIIYIPGNHEYYGSVYEDCLAQMRERADGTWVHVLDRDIAVIDNVRFLGATLWTDYRASLNTAIPDLNMAMFHAGRLINDHRQIRVRAPDSPDHSRLLMPSDAAAWHAQTRRWLEANLAQPHDGPTAVVTHHGPCPLAQHPRFTQGALSGAYWSDLSELFDGADLWIYGHTHAAIDTTIGQMRLVSNQAGYPHESGAGFKRIKLVEV